MMMKSEKIGCIVTMLMALLVLSCTSDETLSSTDSLETVPVSLAMNVSTNRASTRMSAEMTQQTGYRGIQDQRLFPFSSDALVNNLISSGKQPLTTYITNLNKYNEETDNLHYFDDRSVKVPNGTTAFLCYCRATPSGSKFENGSLITNIVKENAENELDLLSSSTTSDITFEPEKIYTLTTNNAVKVPDAANAIAAYLTDIANAIPEDKRDFFLQFVNNSHPVACSSTNVEKLEAWAVSNEVTLPTPRPTNLAGYPANISLPDGVAVVKWDYTSKKFVPQVQTNTDVNNINSLNRFVYPPELYYYANSRIKTSRSSRKQDYSKKSWDAVLDTYDAGYGEMDFSVHSVAIIDPLSYAVGCLQVGLNVQSTLQDAAGKTITLEDGTTENKDASFPLKAILISSQFAQGYDFTPKGEVDEYIIYDPTIEGNISMGGSIVPTPTTPSQYTNTLVLQTKDNENVRFALEFENNSGEDFEGINGKVFKGTKFYLVGTIKVPAVVDQDKDFKKRVFTKNHITQGVVRISSLKEAYTYLPDLLDPRLEVGIQLVPNWIQVTTTNVPL
ncbi:MAG: hypothetical protein J6T00_02640 [Bacteroidaceae bacterium]|nr:hypothetical protein [Bacteroidaceae bacterium]